MAKKDKKILKKETIERIENLVKIYSDKEDLIKSDKYKSLYEHYLNSVERQNSDIIVDSVYNGLTFEDIVSLISTDNKSVIEQETDAIFMISEQKVVEAPRVDLIIGDDKIKPTGVDLFSETLFNMIKNNVSEDEIKKFIGNVFSNTAEQKVEEPKVVKAEQKVEEPKVVKAENQSQYSLNSLTDRWHQSALGIFFDTLGW